MRQDGWSMDAVRGLVYVGSAGLRGGVLHSRLQDHLQKSGWQTAFRRKVFEHILGTPEQPRTCIQYKDHLRQARSEITAAIVANFSFKCLATEDFGDFEKWLIQKHHGQLWNREKYDGKVIARDFSELESKLLQAPLIPFRDFDKHLLGIPSRAGIYLVFRK